MSFSKTVKDELLKKDFTAYEKAFNIEKCDLKLEKARGFLRERFLDCGSVTDPSKDYHLEFSASSETEAQEILKQLRRFGLTPGLTERGKHQVVYLKDASQISDVLKLLGSVDGLLAFENVRILKEVSENVNRRVNFETANINRTVQASLRQTEDIVLIRDRIGLEHLEEGLREIAEARLKDPDASLEELAAGLPEPIGKSGANHRMRRIARIAAELRVAELPEEKNER